MNVSRTVDVTAAFNAVVTGVSAKSFTVKNAATGAAVSAVNRGAIVTATLSEVVTGVETSTFTVKNAITGAVVSAVVTRNGTTKQWILNPGADLTAKTRYTATLTGGAGAIRDAAGNPLVTNTWSFTTGA